MDEWNDLLALLARLLNAILWTWAARHFLPRGLEGRLVGYVIVVGMWVFVFGALAKFNTTIANLASPVYTGYTLLAAAIALGIVTGRKRG
jgi:hypothetical protein